MPGAALVSFIMAASMSALKYISRKETPPSTRNIPSASWKVRRTWLRLPWALASLTSLDTATGRPAVEMVSSTA